ncbi:hypothetical protein FDO65_01130 [Nakamurella flava]|uniref:Uncharacterized protein n=1 Tax=Nakamurella flava TaxID=2576308 RepID=A0A4U6QIW8_9ACTN|nr:hypothetical protein [Nakamurella flava]TKV60350.1 hypothetical protein FDO65_01130 [Nakamurella flava]
MGIKRVTLAAAAAATSILLGSLAACAAGGPGDGTAGSAQNTAGAPTTTYPLDQFFTGPSVSPEESTARERQVQDLIVSCMQTEGFEYRPFVQPVMTDTTIDTGPQWGTREFAEKYGYGMTTDPWSAMPQPTDQPVDPNQAIVDAMSDSEREAYYAALHGAPMMAESSMAEMPSDTETTVSVTAVTGTSEPQASTASAGTEITPTPSAPDDPAAESSQLSELVTTMATAGPVDMQDMGCWGQAQEQVWGTGYQQGEEFADLQNRMSQLWDQGMKEPAVLQAQDDWSSCMSDAGHPGFSTVDAAQQSINDRVNKLYESLPQPDPSELETASPTAALVTGNPLTTAPGYSDLRSEEIALAVADFDCREKAGYQKALDEANQRLQQQFVDDNRAELERYRDAMNGGG